MDKYRGKYRVVCEFNRDNLEPNKEDNFIYCTSESQIYRVNNNTLAYYRENGATSTRMLEKLTEANVDFVNMTHGETLIYFKEKDLDKTVDIFKIRTSGAGYNPSSKKNLKLFKWFTGNEQYYKDKGLLNENKRPMSDEEREKRIEVLRLAREKKNR